MTDYPVSKAIIQQINRSAIQSRMDQHMELLESEERQRWVQAEYERMMAFIRQRRRQGG